MHGTSSDGSQPNKKSTMDELAQRSENQIQWIYDQVDGADLPSNLRGRLSGGCLSTALEHASAIALLAKNGMYGSAFALVRVTFETYVRGVWLSKCATEKDLDRYVRGKISSAFEELIAAIESQDGFNVGVLSDIKKRSWKSMNSFTHSGYDQIVRRQTETTIEANYEDSEVEGVIGFAIAMAFLSGVTIAEIAQNMQLANGLFAEMQRSVRLDKASAGS